MNLTEKLSTKEVNIKDDFYAAHHKQLEDATNQIHAKFGYLTGITLVEAMHALIDTLQNDTNYSDVMQCGKQECSFCCHAEIFLGQFEVDYIKSQGTFTIDQERLAKQRTTVYKDLPFADRACIMLKDGKCQVYAHRPALCRNHGVALGVDPNDCYEQNLNVGTVFIQQPRSILLEAIQVYMTIRGCDSDPTQIKNIADYNW